MTYQYFERHPLSSFFYDMPKEEYESLKDSISKCGVLNPIMIADDMILDGWHRYKACFELDIECPYEYFEEKHKDLDVRDFVIAQNKERKTLTKSQLAFAVAQVSEWMPNGTNQYSENEGGSSRATLSAEDIAKKSGTSRATIKRAKQVIREGSDELKEAVMAGKIGLTKAAEISKLPTDEQLDAISKPLPKKESPRTSDSSESISSLKKEIEKLRAFYETLSEMVGLSDFEEIISYFKNLKEESSE